MKTCLLAVSLASTLLLAGCEFAPPLPTTTETITFNVTNDTSRTLLVSFFSQDRDAAWPGGGRDYIVQPRASQSFALTCRTTEQVCYGAYPQGERYSGGYWGVGPDNDQWCENCCYACGTFETDNIRFQC